MAGGGGGGGSDDDDGDEVPADTEITANMLDMIIKNKKEKTHLPVNVAILADRNAVQKEAEKKQKYKSLLCIEIQRMWNLKYMIIPVITGATGIVTKVGNIRSHIRETFNRSTSKEKLYLEHHT